jgi:hypothetical protein
MMECCSLVELLQSSRLALGTKSQMLLNKLTQTGSLQFELESLTQA